MVCDHQIGQVGFLWLLMFLPTLELQRRFHLCHQFCTKPSIWCDGTCDICMTLFMSWEGNIMSRERGIMSCYNYVVGTTWHGNAIFYRDNETLKSWQQDISWERDIMPWDRDLICRGDRDITSWEGAIMWWERHTLSRENDILKSWDLAIISSERGIMSWERGIMLLERGIVSLERDFMSLERGILPWELDITSWQRDIIGLWYYVVAGR